MTSVQPKVSGNRQSRQAPCERRFLRTACVLIYSSAVGAVAWPSPGRGEELAPPQVRAIIKDYIATHPDEIGAIVKDYLVNHPEFLKEVFIELAKRKQAVKGAGDGSAAAITDASTMERATQIENNAGALFNSPHQVVIGNRSGDVTLVEFFDYSCGFCKRGLAHLMTLVAEDPQLRVVLKELPILGPGSADAAKVAIAVRMQDADGSRALAFHKTLLGKPGPATKDAALAVARELNFDMARIEQDIDGAEVRATLEETANLAKGLGIRGTPAYVVGDQVVFGAVGAKPIMRQIAITRAHHSGSK